jgi:hypothetical protein
VVVEELVEGVVGRLGRPKAHEPAGQERRMKFHRRKDRRDAVGLRT